MDEYTTQHILGTNCFQCDEVGAMDKVMNI